MNSRLLRPLAMLLPLLLPWAGATTFRALNPEQLALGADMVFLGTVESVDPVTESGFLWTDVSYQVEEWFLDDRPAAVEDEQQEPRMVTLRFLGGVTPSGQRLSVSAVPTYRLGQRVLLFAYDRAGLASPVVGVQQGSFTIDALGAGSVGGFLSVTPAGGLELAPSGSSVEAVGEALRQLLQTGTAPATAPPTPEPDATEPPTPEPDATEPEPAEPPVEGAESEAASAATAQQPSAPLTVRYRVDDAGGPLLLSTAVGRAAAAWESAAPGAIDFEQVEAAASGQDMGAAPVTSIGYGAANLFGPDALSFTLLKDGVAQLLVSPTVGDLIGEVLLHELGVLAGLMEGGSGTMANTVTAGNLTPTQADIAALTQLRQARPEDINRDGVVDFYDLATLAAAYGTAGLNLAADINGDGVVDDADLAALRAAYQFTPPAEQPPAR